MPRPSTAGYPFRIGRAKTGLGLFATEVIPKHVRIFEYTGNIITNAEADAMPGKPRYLYNLSRTHTLDGSPRSNIGRYANHSCKPNGDHLRLWRPHLCEVAARDPARRRDHLRLRQGILRRLHRQGKLPLPEMHRAPREGLMRKGLTQ